MPDHCTCHDKYLRARVFEAERQYLAERTPYELLHYAEIVAHCKRDWGLCEYCNKQLFTLVFQKAVEAKVKVGITP
jgi:hypothetical protein